MLILEYLSQILPEKTKTGTKGRLAVVRHEREAIRQCFLFSNHLIITTRTQAGRLHLVEQVGKISLAEVTLTEDPGDEEKADEGIAEEVIEKEKNNNLF